MVSHFGLLVSLATVFEDIKKKSLQGKAILSVPYALEPAPERLPTTEMDIVWRPLAEKLRGLDVVYVTGSGNAGTKAIDAYPQLLVKQYPDNIVNVGAADIFGSRKDYMQGRDNDGYLTLSAAVPALVPAVGSKNKYGLKDGTSHCNAPCCLFFLNSHGVNYSNLREKSRGAGGWIGGRDLESEYRQPE